MKLKIYLIIALVVFTSTLFLLNPKEDSFYKDLCNAANSNPTIGIFSANTKYEREQGLKNQLIYNQIVYKDFKLFSLGIFKTTFTDSNLIDDYAFKQLNEEYDNKIISIGIMGHLFILNDIIRDLLLYNQKQKYIFESMTRKGTDGISNIDFWKDYFKNSSHGLTIGSWYNGGYIIYLLRENDNINLYTDSVNFIKYDKDVVHGIIIKDFNEKDDTYISLHDPKIKYGAKKLVWNQFVIGNAVRNNNFFFPSANNNKWVIPTLSELELIYYSRNYLTNLNLKGNLLSSSMTPDPRKFMVGWLMDFDNEEIIFDKYFMHKRVLIQYF